MGEAATFDDAFRIEDFFLGSSRAHGIFQDRFGRLRLRFLVEIDGSWDGGQFVLAERFVYDDGRRERRTWRIDRLGDGAYRGTADDILGVAEGTAAGPCVTWRYLMSLSINGRRWAMRFDDSFFKVGDAVINRARMSKFGVWLGEATIVFRR